MIFINALSGLPSHTSRLTNNSLAMLTLTAFVKVLAQVDNPIFVAFPKMWARMWFLCHRVRTFKGGKTCTL